MGGASSSESGSMGLGDWSLDEMDMFGARGAVKETLVVMSRVERLGSSGWFCFALS